MTLVEKAEMFAREKHKGMCRPNKAKQPCVEHLGEVAALARRAGCSECAVAAAWLHDVVEDTSTTIDEVRDVFGEQVADLVDSLTDPIHFAELPLSIRKSKQAERLTKKDGEVILVKLCDQISNVLSVLDDPPYDWLPQKSLEYVQGAKQIAQVCMGRSDYLDDLFGAAYMSSVRKYSSSEKEDSYSQ